MPMRAGGSGGHAVATVSTADVLRGDRKAALVTALDEKTVSLLKRAVLKLSRRKVPPAARRHLTY
jgi:hypothetical protein